MLRRLRSGTLLFALLLLSRASSAQVPGEEIARRAFEDGVALEKRGDFAAALAKFKESEQIKPTLGNRYHKALCLEMTGKLAAAFIEYEVVERTARETSKAELLEATRVRLEPLRAKVPQLSLRLVGAKAADVEVAVDDAPVAVALLDGKAFRIDPGQHVVTGRAPGRESFSKTWTAAEGSLATIEVVLPEPAPAPPPVRTVATNEPPAGSARSRTLPIVTTAGAVVLAVGGVGAYLLAGEAQSEGKASCATKASSTCDEQRGSTRTFDALALGGFIGAAGLAALSVVLWTSAPSSGSTARASTRLVARSSWLGWEGQF